MLEASHHFDFRVILYFWYIDWSLFLSNVRLKLLHSVESNWSNGFVDVLIVLSVLLHGNVVLIEVLVCHYFAVVDQMREFLGEIYLAKCSFT